MVYRGAPCESAILTDDSLPTGRLFRCTCKETMSVGARTGHDTDDVAIVAVGDDRGVAMAIVATAVSSARYGLRVAPGAALVVRVLSYEVAV